MSFELRFKEEALNEWQRLEGAIREQFKKKLAERFDHPCVPAAKLAGHPSRYKIKLRSAGFRLVYEVRESDLVVVVIAIGKRDRSAVYKAAAKR